MKRDAVPSPPSPLALEAAAVALQTLVRKKRAGWTLADFTRLTRLRTTVEASSMATFLTRAGVLEERVDTFGLTPEGRSTVEQLAQGQWAAFAAAVLGTGAFNAEIEALLGVAETDAMAATCEFARLRRQAPRVSAVLAWNASYRVGKRLVVPLALLEGVLAATTIDVVEEAPEWVRELQRVGCRAEAYTLRRERSLHGADKVLHVSRDSGDRFGYDVETLVPPTRCIEVKGSRSATVSFMLTRTERKAARQLADRHEVQFWGEISLQRRPEDEYQLLVQRGYPRFFYGLAEALEADEQWSLQCEVWRVTLSPDADASRGEQS